MATGPSSDYNLRIGEITSFLSSRCPSFKKLSEANVSGVVELFCKQTTDIPSESKKKKITTTTAAAVPPAPVTSSNIIICDNNGDDTRILFENFCTFATTSKTTQPSIYLACIAESALLSKTNNAAIYLSGSCAASLRNLFIQCIHGAAPETGLYNTCNIYYILIYILYINIYIQNTILPIPYRHNNTNTYIMH